MIRSRTAISLILLGLLLAGGASADELLGPSTDVVTPGQLEAELEKLLARTPLASGNYRDHYEIGNLYYDLQHYREAAERYQRAIDINPKFIEAIVAETGQTGFHFVDEAAPPKALKALAEELLRRRVAISWWGNIRFEKTFTPELCQLLADSGCIAISGGLEVASDRLLKLMKKGVSVEQVPA